jgi:hypothetical protein
MEVVMPTLKDALEGFLEGSWSDDKGEWWSSRQILEQWPDERLSQPVEVVEDREGYPEIRQGESGRGPVLLRFTPPSDTKVSLEPSTIPE